MNGSYPPLSILDDIKTLKKEIAELKKEEYGTLNIESDFNISEKNYAKFGKIVSIRFVVNNNGDTFPYGRFLISFPLNLCPRTTLAITVPASKSVNSNTTEYATFILTPGGYAAIDNPSSEIKEIAVSATYISN